MNYPVEMGSDVLTYIPSFIITGSEIRVFVEGHRDTQKASGREVG
jgi:hypothetical protein